MPSCNDGARHMRARGHGAAVQDGTNRIGILEGVASAQPLADGDNAFASQLHQPGKMGGQCGVLRVDAKAHHVQLLPAPAGGDLHAIDEPDAGCSSGAGGLREPGGGVVVGERQHLYLARGSQRHEPGRQHACRRSGCCGCAGR